MRKVILGLLTVWSLVFATSIEKDIERLLEEVKKAPPSERYKVMNELKLRLRELNERDREEAIERVYRKLKGKEHMEREEQEHRYEREHEERYDERHEERYEEKYEERYEEKFEEKMEERREKYEERYEDKSEGDVDKDVDMDMGDGNGGKHDD